MLPLRKLENCAKGLSLFFPNCMWIFTDFNYFQFSKKIKIKKDGSLYLVCEPQLCVVVLPWEDSKITGSFQHRGAWTLPQRFLFSSLGLGPKHAHFFSVPGDYNTQSGWRSIILVNIKCQLFCLFFSFLSLIRHWNLRNILRKKI
jgi:hypothetical protein